ncbi:hypothetical protein Pmar_PMAR003649, partial [Perkinsus marinus ATCC 50983]
MLPLKNCYIVCTGPNGVKETESNGDTAAGERTYASSDYNHGYYNHSHWQYGSPYHKQNKWRSWRNWYPRRSPTTTMDGLTLKKNGMVVQRLQQR